MSSFSCDDVDFNVAGLVSVESPNELISSR